MRKYYIIGVSVSMVLACLICLFANALAQAYLNSLEFHQALMITLCLIPGGLLAGFIGSRIEKKYSKYIGWIVLLTIILGIILSIGLGALILQIYFSLF